MNDADPTTATQFFYGVTDMSCPRSAARVMQALKTLDEDARVQIDLPMRRLEVLTQQVGHVDLHGAIWRAGFTPLRQWPTPLFCA